MSDTAVQTEENAPERTRPRLKERYRAEIVTYDHDFARFPGISWARPDDLLPR